MLNKLFFILPFLLPSYLVKFNLPSRGSVNLLDLLLLSLLCLLSYNIISRRKEAVGIFLMKNKRALALLVIFLSGLFFSFFLNLSKTDWTDSLGIIKSFYVLPILFALFACFYASQNKTLLKNFFAGYFIYSSLLATVGIFYLLNHNLTYDNRLSIFFESPNQLAMALAPGIIIGLSWIFALLKKHRHEKNNPWFMTIQIAPIFLITLIQTFFFIQTESLGAMIGIAFATIFLIFGKIQKQILLLAITLSLASLFLIFNASFLLKLTGYTPNIPANALDSRLAIYQANEKMIKNNFIIGIGANNFQKVYLDYQIYFPPYPQWAVPHAHNLLASIWLESGILGFLSFLLVFYFFYKKTPRGEDYVRTYVMTSVSILIYFLIHGLFDATYWKNDLAVVFWFVILLSLAYFQSPKENFQLKKESLEFFQKS